MSYDVASRATKCLPFDVRYIAAPMVNQSDLPFRTLVQNHGATLAYTQMLQPSRLESDPDYLAFHRRDLSLSPRPVVVQLYGNDPDGILRGARKIVDLCDGIGAPDTVHPRVEFDMVFSLRKADH
jgi:tRNA-dihydrouridine synthase